MSASAPAPFVLASYDAQVADTIAELSVCAFPHGLNAVVLTGSLARGEGTWLNGGSLVRLAGDADFLGVFDDRAALPTPDRVAQLKREAKEHLASAGIEANIGLSPVSASYLRRLRPAILSYELITHGKVVWGDPHILNLVPAFAASEIPTDDGFRLLMNRMIELLEIVCEHDTLAANAREIPYRAMKLWLDMATSYLLFERQYVPTYRGRAARLRELGAESSTGAPIRLRRFSRMVAFATRYKLGEFDTETQEFADLATLIDAAHSLWRWELERLTAPCASDIDLQRRWIGAEPIAARIRGWAAVVERSGIVRAIARTPDWIRMARKGSPRRLICAAASELIFALPRLLEEDAVPGVDSHWDELRRGLPVTDSPENLPLFCSWRRLGRAIAFNYNSFLVPTRS